MCFMISSILLLVWLPVQMPCHVLQPCTCSIRKWPKIERSEDQMRCSSFQSLPGFWLLWLWPLLRKGAQRPLKEEDIYENPSWNDLNDLNESLWLFRLFPISWCRERCEECDVANIHCILYDLVVIVDAFHSTGCTFTIESFPPFRIPHCRGMFMIVFRRSN